MADRAGRQAARLQQSRVQWQKDTQGLCLPLEVDDIYKSAETNGERLSGGAMHQDFQWHHEYKLRSASNEIARPRGE